MIRPEGEIEFPPSAFARMKASMLARMEALNSSTEDLMYVIAQRLGAENSENDPKIEELTAEQERLIENMRKLVQSKPETL